MSVVSRDLGAEGIRTQAAPEQDHSRRVPGSVKRFGCEQSEPRVVARVGKESALDQDHGFVRKEREGFRYHLEFRSPHLGLCFGTNDSQARTGRALQFAASALVGAVIQSSLIDAG